VLEAGSGIKFQLLLLFNIVGPFLGPNKELGGASKIRQERSILFVQERSQSSHKLRNKNEMKFFTTTHVFLKLRERNIYFFFFHSF
jgi:hypothetical protein